MAGIGRKRTSKSNDFSGIECPLLVKADIQDLRLKILLTNLSAAKAKANRPTT
jgi:hypothetical protein